MPIGSLIGQGKQQNDQGNELHRVDGQDQENERIKRPKSWLTFHQAQKKVWTHWSHWPWK